MQLALNLPHPLAAREVLFLSTDGQLFTTSRAVAERFGKRHSHVLRAIENLIADIGGCPSQPNFGLAISANTSFSERNFASAGYLDAQKKLRIEYRLTHDGFALLAMGFTGRDALAWKIAFLAAFNAMEAELTARTARFAHALDQVRPCLRPVTEATEHGLSRAAIAGPLGKSPAAITYHRRAARRLGLLAA